MSPLRDLRTCINGVKMHEVDDDSPEARAQRSGALGFQLQAGDPMIVRFWDIRLKELPPLRDPAE